MCGVRACFAGLPQRRRPGKARNYSYCAQAHVHSSQQPEGAAPHTRTHTHITVYDRVAGGAPRNRYFSLEPCVRFVCACVCMHEQTMRNRIFIFRDWTTTTTTTSSLLCVCGLRERFVCNLFCDGCVATLLFVGRACNDYK